MRSHDRPLTLFLKSIRGWLSASSYRLRNDFSNGIRKTARAAWACNVTLLWHVIDEHGLQHVVY